MSPFKLLLIPGYWHILYHNP